MLYERRDLTAPKALCGLFGRGGPLEFPIVDGGGAGRAACVARSCEMSRFRLPSSRSLGCSVLSCFVCGGPGFSASPTRSRGHRGPSCSAEQPKTRADRIHDCRLVTEQCWWHRTMKRAVVEHVCGDVVEEGGVRPGE